MTESNLKQSKPTEELQNIRKRISEAGESPMQSGDCLCGILNCAGHPAIDGEIYHLDHPLGHGVISAPPDRTDEKLPPGMFIDEIGTEEWTDEDLKKLRRDAPSDEKTPKKKG